MASTDVQVQDELKPGLEAEESGAPAKGGGSRAWGPVAELATAMRPLLTGRLRRTTLLLMLIWFVNALCYYGLVLLTTTVCPMAALDFSFLRLPGGQMEDTLAS